jgi:hypothetical protein
MWSTIVVVPPQPPPPFRRKNHRCAGKADIQIHVRVNIDPSRENIFSGRVDNLRILIKIGIAARSCCSAADSKRLPVTVPDSIRIIRNKDFAFSVTIGSVRSSVCIISHPVLPRRFSCSAPDRYLPLSRSREPWNSHSVRALTELRDNHPAA